jgi:exosome complex exonuclease RRP6
MDPVRLEADEILQCIKKLPDTIRDVERLAQRVPSDVDFHFFSNFQEFKAPIRGMQAQVESLLNEIGMAKELRPQVAAWPNDPDETYDWLVGVQDDLVEGIDTALDQFELEKRAQKKGKSKSEPEKTMQVQTVMQQQSSDGFTEVVKLSKPRKQVHEGRSIPFHIRSIPRPQDKFDIAPDNSNTPFKHPCSLNNSEKKNGGTKQPREREREREREILVSMPLLTEA